MQPDLNEPYNQAKSNYSNLQGIFAGQKADTGDFLGRYGGAIKGLESIPGMASRIGNELGLPALRQNAQSLNQTLSDIPGTYKDATTGFDVNANQLSRIVGTKQAAIAPLAQKATTQFQNAQDSLNTQMGYTQAEQNRSLLPYQSEQGLLSDRLARETTGYTQVMGQELDALISKMNAGVTLSEGEKNRAQELAMSEKNFNNQKSLLAEQAKYSSPQNSYISVGEGTAVYDPASGQMLYKNPKTYQGAAGGEGSIYDFLPQG